MAAPPQDPQILSKPPTFSDDTQLDTLMKTKLRLESVLEASRDPAPVELPPGSRPKLLGDVMEAAHHDTQRALAYYKEMDKALDKKLVGIDTYIRRCKDICVALKKTTSLPTQDAEFAKLRARAKGANGGYQAFRRQFKKVMEMVDEEHEDLNLSAVLQALSNQMMDDPNDPYLEMGDIGCDENTLIFLIVNNMAERHSTNSRMIKLLDPRSR